MKCIRFMATLPLIALLFMSSSCYGTISEQTGESKKIVNEAGQWFIEEGLAKYYQGEDAESLRMILKEYGAHTRAAEVVMENDGYIAQLWLEHAWVRGFVTCYSRIETDMVYEYWALQLDATREEVPREIYFMVTRSEGIDKKREVIHRAERFFPEFNTAEETSIRFPTNNKSIYNLKPWRFPDAFKGTELEGVKVIIDDNGDYIKIKDY